MSDMTVSFTAKRVTTKFVITGQVQGVGFRPFIYRMAKKNHLSGWVKNCSGEVSILVQGKEHNIEAFKQAILNQHPPLAQPVIDTIQTLEHASIDSFVIKESIRSQSAQHHIPPDFFTCNDCLDEISNPQERRYRYPFINCTQCGPRYTIIKDLPYDRPNTSLSSFPLCDACHVEYSNTLDRRFHAQPLACAKCGPELSFKPTSDKTLTEPLTKKRPGNEASLKQAIEILTQGKILAVKGVGGYHLMCDATNEQAVQCLRERKHRPNKPLALMFSVSAKDELEQLNHYCIPSEAETKIISSPQRPIVLIKAKKGLLAPSINPGLNEVGAMLAYSPLHYLLLKDFGLPLVATSGNLSGEPVLTDNTQAQTRLKTIADAFLQHNRPILRPADDTLIRVIQNKKRLLRIGRGFAPLELNLTFHLKKPTLAVGGQMKNTIALAWDNRVVISPHIGELDTKRSIEVFSQVIDDLCHLYRVKPEQVICDAHPDYYSSRYAKNYALKNNIPLISVQHHKAHASIVCGDFLLNDQSLKDNKPWLVFSWDGTGLGDDQTIWGGEGFYGQPGNWQRVTSIKPFYLQGGDKAAREPWRSACSLLWSSKEWETEQYLPDSERNLLAFQAWKKRINTIQTSSMGRLFDAASALLGLGENSSFEGQGPMQLEALITLAESESKIEFTPSALNLYTKNNLLLADWSELLPLLLNHDVSIEQRAFDFHLKIAETLIAKAKKIKLIKGDFRVGLSGGVFQNKFLSEYILKRLKEENFEAYLPENIPYNDAGLAFGQIIEAHFL